MPKKQPILPMLIIVVITLGSIAGAASFTIVKFSLGDELNLGYEGAKVFWEGINIQPDGRYGTSGLTWRIGDQRPTIFGSSGTGPSTWTFNRQNFDLDPLGDYSQWQNLIGITRTSGIMENIPGTNMPLTQSLGWDINLGVDENGNARTRHVEARSYFFLTELEFKVRVDEQSSLFGVATSTEKRDYWRDFTPIAIVHVNNFQPLGNETSWARILGVEIVKTEINYATDKGRDATRVDSGFFQSQMLALYRTWEQASGNGAYDQSQRADSTLSKLVKTDPSNGNLQDTNYVILPFSAFGVDAGLADSWTIPQYIVTLRVHVLKVDKWIAIQKVAASFKESDTQKPTGFNVLDITGGLKSWFQNPFNQIFMIMAMVVILVIVILVSTPIGLVILRRGGK